MSFEDGTGVRKLKNAYTQLHKVNGLVKSSNTEHAMTLKF
jgi:hypothetical protein